MKRTIGLVQATALNMIDMVGIGPFVVVMDVITAMNGPQCIMAWIAGALLAFVDSQSWSELGAKLPNAGGSYSFLRETYSHIEWKTTLFGDVNLGRYMSFLFIWQTIFQASFVVASAAIGFANYAKYLLHFNDPLIRQLISGGAVLLVIIALYRKIETIGKLSVVMWVAVLGTMLWIIIAGATHFNPDLAFTYPEGAWSFDGSWFKGLGDSMQYTVYAYLGYYNVCHLGSEIKQPEKNIPRSMLISIVGIAILYCAMQLSVLGVMPWQEAMKEKYVMSKLIEICYGSTAGIIVTSLILFVAFTSLFAVVLGYSRIPYAAAKDGNFFLVFGRTHPTKDFPHISLLVFGFVSLIISISFDSLKPVVTMILTMRILVQFVGQTVGLILYRRHTGKQTFPYKMFLYPIPVVLSLSAWLWLYGTRTNEAIWYSLGFMALGTLVFVYRQFMQSDKRLT